MEYEQRYYEGGFTLYGSASAEVFTARLEHLTRTLSAAGWVSPPVQIPAFPVFSGGHKEVVRFGAGSSPPYRPILRKVKARPNGSVLTWEDDGAEWVIPRRSTIVVIERAEGASWVPVARDGMLEVEVRVQGRGGRAHWEVQWSGPRVPNARYRFRLPDPAVPGEGAVIELP